jgi:hypothetical protein
MYWIKATFDHESGPDDRHRAEQVVWDASWEYLTWQRQYVRVRVTERPPGAAPWPGGGPMRKRYQLVVGITPNSASQEFLDSLVEDLRKVPHVQSVETQADEPLAAAERVQPPGTDDL